MIIPKCHYCGRDDQALKPCCHHHPDRLVCADAEDCTAYVLAGTPDPDGAK
jgi:hypothetical protein